MSGLVAVGIALRGTPSAVHTPPMFIESVPCRARSHSLSSARVPPQLSDLGQIGLTKLLFCTAKFGKECSERQVGDDCAKGIEPQSIKAAASSRLDEKPSGADMTTVYGRSTPEAQSSLVNSIVWCASSLTLWEKKKKISKNSGEKRLQIQSVQAFFHLSVVQVSSDCRLEVRYLSLRHSRNRRRGCDKSTSPTVTGCQSLQTPDSTYLKRQKSQDRPGCTRQGDLHTDILDPCRDKGDKTAAGCTLKSSAAFAFAVAVPYPQPNAHSFVSTISISTEDNLIHSPCIHYRQLNHSRCDKTKSPRLSEAKGPSSLGLPRITINPATVTRCVSHLGSCLLTLACNRGSCKANRAGISLCKSVKNRGPITYNSTTQMLTFIWQQRRHERYYPEAPEPGFLAVLLGWRRRTSKGVSARVLPPRLLAAFHFTLPHIFNCPGSARPPWTEAVEPTNLSPRRITRKTTAHNTWQTSTALAGPPHSTLSRAELRPSTYIIYGLTTSETIYVLCKPVYLAHQHLPFGLELRYASSQFTDGARDHQVPEEVPELDPRLLGRETRRFQGQEDGMPGFVLLLNTPMTNGFWISKISHFSDSKKVVACMQEMDATPRTEGRQPATPMHAALVIWNHFNTTTHSAVLSHLQRLPSSPWLVTRIHVKHFSKVSSVQLSRIVCSAPSRHTTMRFELPCTSYPTLPRFRSFKRRSHISRTPTSHRPYHSLRTFMVVVGSTAGVIRSLARRLGGLTIVPWLVALQPFRRYYTTIALWSFLIVARYSLAYMNTVCDRLQFGSFIFRVRASSVLLKSNPTLFASVGRSRERTNLKHTLSGADKAVIILRRSALAAAFMESCRVSSVSTRVPILRSGIRKMSTKPGSTRRLGARTRQGLDTYSWNADVKGRLETQAGQIKSLLNVIVTDL
ncbi:Uncharacterized protein LW94_11995 [Fusarium fujikuroi]|nr:Uncharacterized protein LW94_11995 [Fusarium fujikuroi]